MKIDLTRVWRDKTLLEEIRAEIKRVTHSPEKWVPWEIILPPDVIYPMIEEISQGMTQQWSPVVDNIGIQVGEQNVITIRFVLPKLNTSPVMTRSMPYTPRRSDDIIPVEVNSGNKIRI